MRLFIALDIDESIRERIGLFQDGVRGFAEEAGWVRPESLHVTLKFIGEKSDDAVSDIQRALAQIAVNKFSLTFRGVGFFPTAKSARVFWVGIESGPELSALAQKVDAAIERLGIPKETHAYTPHDARAGTAKVGFATAAGQRWREQHVRAATRTALPNGHAGVRYNDRASVLPLSKQDATRRRAVHEAGALRIVLIAPTRAGAC